MEPKSLTKPKIKSQHGGSYCCIPHCTSSTSKGVKLFKVFFGKKKIWSLDRRLVQPVSTGTDLSKKTAFLCRHKLKWGTSQ